MDATGLSAFSALPLAPLMLAFWWWEGFSRQEMGFRWGGLRHHGLAAAYPLAAIGAVAVGAALAGQVETAAVDWGTSGLELTLVAVSSVLAVTITEEGFFRGWLWRSLESRGLGDGAVLVWSSVAFSLWHVSAVTLETGFDLPARQVPVYLVNATVMGLGWGLLRRVSGSIFVASVSHGLWNGLAYTGFGFGTRSGALGVRDTAVWGPEVGIVGLAVNALVVFLLWRLTRRSAPPIPASSP